MVPCPECKYEKEIIIPKSLDVSADPKSKKPFLSGKINLFECEKCGFMDDPPPIEGVEYTRTPQVVFHLTELIRYVIIHERLNGFYGSERF
ncbi:MAG: hypothetical protein GY866_26380 [Proteobacteria bacterium]|nr:hypothetical protein [Pseudomonadota bacterium]